MLVPDSEVFIFSQPNEKKNLVIAFNWLIKVDNFKKQKLLDKINFLNKKKINPRDFTL